MPQETDLLTTSELARYLRKPVGTIHAWRRRRVGPPGFRLGRDVVYRRSAVDSWLQSLETADQGSDHATRGVA